jgi:hypothetical protein
MQNQAAVNAAAALWRQYSKSGPDNLGAPPAASKQYDQRGRESAQRRTKTAAQRAAAPNSLSEAASFLEIAHSQKVLYDSQSQASILSQ